MNSKQWGELAQNITKVALTEKEAQKVFKNGIDNSKVVKKITPQNWYKNERFWFGIGSIIVAGATGDYVSVIPFAQEILSSFF